MWTLSKPGPERLCDFIAEQSQLDFTYSATGATAATPPSGYVVDHTRIKLGDGEKVFAAAKAALEHWQQFQFDWLEAGPNETPIKTGEVVAILVRVCGLWWWNACRIVYVVDETGPIVRFGFAYGTLPGHAESGEERFLIEWNRADNGVWYDILAFSRPHVFLVRIGYPIVRRMQRKFAQESSAAMRRAVDSATSPASFGTAFR